MNKYKSLLVAGSLLILVGCRSLVGQFTGGDRRSGLECTFDQPPSPGRNIRIDGKLPLPEPRLPNLPEEAIPALEPSNPNLNPKPAQLEEAEVAVGEAALEQAAFEQVAGGKAPFEQSVALEDVVYQRPPLSESSRLMKPVDLPAPRADIELPLEDPTFIPPPLNYERYIAALSLAEGAQSPMKTPRQPEAPAEVAQSSMEARASRRQEAPAKTAKSPVEAAHNPTKVAQSPAKAAPDPVERELYARRGDRIEIGLEGRGWIFIGQETGGNEPKTEEGLAFLSREPSNGRTLFSFEAREFGSYSLIFLLQNNSNGAERREKARINVVGEEEFQDFLSGAMSRVPAEQPSDRLRYHLAERYYAMGELESALREYLREYRDGSHYLNDRVASIYIELGELQAAVKYYRKNLDDGGPYRDRAILGLIRLSLAMGDGQLLFEHLPSFLELEPADTEEELLKVARFQSERGRYSSALNLLEEYERRYLDGPHLDEVYFLTAHILEQDSSRRDLERSRNYYQKVYNLFPESSFAERANLRARYLDRHFFHIR